MSHGAHTNESEFAAFWGLWMSFGSFSSLRNVSECDAALSAKMPGQGLIQRQRAGSLEDHQHRESENEDVIFNSVAFFISIPVHKESKFPVNCKQRHAHDHGDAQSGDAA